MRKIRFLIPVFILLFSVNYSKAQDNIEDSVYQNSDDDYEDEKVDNGPDTALFYSDKYISIDTIEAYKNHKSFAYAKNLDSMLRKLQQKQNKLSVNVKPRKSNWLVSFFTSDITAYFFWTLAAIFVLFVLYKLFFTKGFFQKRTLKNSVAALPDEEDLSMTADYDKLISRSIAEKNYRLAVRYLYLQALQKLSANGAINLAVDKTNYQYVRELAGKSYKNNFASLTLNYEYVWYGEFEIDETIFLKLETEFKQFLNQI